MAKVLQSGLSRHVHPIAEVRETKLHEPSEQVLALPFYNLLPTDHIELLKFRIYVRERCLKDLEFRADIIEMCRLDICFFANVFCWVFEPRPPRPIPVKLWNDQADCLVWIKECFETERDLGAEKTRGIGFSCIMAIFCYWASRFIPECKGAITTKDESVLDGPDANTILGKIVYTHDHMPAWFRLDANGKDIIKRNLTEHLLLFTDNQSTIQGFPPTDQKMRSLRFTYVFYDEFAFFPRDAQKSLDASGGTAPCRIFVSTWNGPDNVFHRIMRKDKNTMLRILCYWWNNEERWRGAYKSEAGRLVILDKHYDYPANYPFVLDGLVRSPWVDYELRRAGANIQSALEELYGLQAEAGRKLFRNDTIELVQTTVRACQWEGEVDLRNGDLVFVPEREGNVWTWGDIGQGKRGPFSAGCDVGFGSGASYSTLEVIDLSTGEQVLDFAENKLEVVSFAQYVYDILRWLNGSKGDGHTFLTFENNGDQGRTFGQEMQRLGYGNIMRRKYASRVPREDAATYLGMRNKDGGLSILAELERAIRAGECMVRSLYVAEEIKLFDKDAETGKPLFPKGEKGHGDRLQGLAMAWFQGRERLTLAPQERKQSIITELENVTHKQSNWSDAWTTRRF